MNPLDFFLQNFNTNCPSSKAIKILPKTSDYALYKSTIDIDIDIDIQACG